jgi:hypothetical protein
VISAQDFNVRAINEANGLLVFRGKHSTPAANSACFTLGQNSAGNPVLGFFGTTTSGKPSNYTQTYATADKTLSAYTSDPESGAYTGIATGVGGTPYAQLTDLNSLRVAYENLRAFTEDAAQMLNSVVDDLQGLGLVG